MEVSFKTFAELQQTAISIWGKYDDTFGYATEKIDRVSNLHHVGDNYGTIIGMFDIKNQRKLYDRVGDEGKAAIDDWVGGLERSEKSMEGFGL